MWLQLRNPQQANHNPSDMLSVIAAIAMMKTPSGATNLLKKQYSKLRKRDNLAQSIRNFENLKNLTFVGAERRSNFQLLFATGDKKRIEAADNILKAILDDQYSKFEGIVKGTCVLNEENFNQFVELATILSKDTEKSESLRRATCRLSDRTCLFQVLCMMNVLKHADGDTDNNKLFYRYCLQFFCHADDYYPTVEELEKIREFVSTMENVEETTNCLSQMQEALKCRSEREEQRTTLQMVCYVKKAQDAILDDPCAKEIEEALKKIFSSNMLKDKCAGNFNEARLFDIFKNNPKDFELEKIVDHVEKKRGNTPIGKTLSDFARRLRWVLDAGAKVKRKTPKRPAPKRPAPQNDSTSNEPVYEEVCYGICSFEPEPPGHLRRAADRAQSYLRKKFERRPKLPERNLDSDGDQRPTGLAPLLPGVAIREGEDQDPRPRPPSGSPPRLDDDGYLEPTAVTQEN
eukprot:GHVH01012424.1.p1 GENE.GHVH01012424.1~~GHVH01012424.1.p1  ORF type:complete len:461 (-),score=49.46 GHVH01012424.1:417-1799(-)